MERTEAIDRLLTEASAPIRWRVKQEILGRKPRTHHKRFLEATFKLELIKKIAG